MFHMLGPTIVARKIAKTRAGRASQASVTRMITWSTQPPRYPGAEDQAAEEIARLEIGSEQGMGAAALHPKRWLEDFCPRNRFSRVVGCDPIGEQRQQDEWYQDSERQHRQLPRQT